MSAVHHTELPPSFGSLEALERFLGHIRIDFDSGCWCWEGAKDQKGYGKSWDHRHWRAHRWSYTYFIGPMPDGLVTDHLCRNHSCVNPWHLEPVTTRENLIRGETLAAGNLAKEYCINGHAFNVENTILSKKGYRDCRRCHREKLIRYRREIAEGLRPKPKSWAHKNVGAKMKGRIVEE